MAIDVTVSGLNTVVDVSMASQPTPIDIDGGSIVILEDYASLINKPQINGVTLSGNKTSSDIGVANASHTHTVSDVTDFPSLATVATSGDYDDLLNKPTIPDAVSVTQIQSTGTNIADITIGDTTTQLFAPDPFVAEFGVTTYADIKDAYDANKTVTCTLDDSGNSLVLQLSYFDVANEVFYFSVPMSDGWYWIQMSNADGWDDGNWYFASPDVATQLADGLMSALDKQKLDGIESGAEVNVQSDWNQATNTADDYIKNKPTNVSSFNNDAGYLTTETDPVFVASDAYGIDSTDIASWNGKAEIAKAIPYAVCSTAALTSPKLVSIPSITALETGLMIAVKFELTNSASSPKLQVNSLEAKSIARYSTTAPSTTEKTSWRAGQVITFVYDGTYWQMCDWTNPDTTYSSMTVAEYEAGTSTSTRVITPERLKDAITYWRASAMTQAVAEAGTSTARHEISADVLKAAVEAHAPVKDVTVDGTSAMDGTTAKLVAFTGTDGLTAGTAGLVPAPATTDDAKFLKADGTWATPSGGGGGTSDYADLTNKPQINSTTLTGNQSSANLGLADAVHTHTTSDVTDFPSLATVATSGDYDDLLNKPTILDYYDNTSSDGISGKGVYSAISGLDGTVSGSAGSGNTLTAFSQTDGKVTATFGSISITKSQVSDFPTIGDATLTIQKNSTNVATFTANASSNVTADISVPTDTGDLTNNAGFLNASGILNLFYPVGSYYETSDTTFDPNQSWGGTWVLETEGQVHVSAGATYVVSGAPTDTTDGGNKDAIIPYHDHTATGGAVSDKAAFNTNSSGTCTISSSGAHTHVQQGWLGASSGSKEVRARKTISGDPQEAGALVSSGAHSHTVPNHAHSIPVHGHGFTQPTISYAGTIGNEINANMQPYIIVNRWHRTA